MHAPSAWPVANAKASDHDAPPQMKPAASPSHTPGVTAGPQRISAAHAKPTAGAKVAINR